MLLYIHIPDDAITLLVQSISIQLLVLNPLHTGYLWRYKKLQFSVSFFLKATRTNNCKSFLMVHLVWRSVYVIWSLLDLSLLKTFLQMGPGNCNHGVALVIRSRKLLSTKAFRLVIKMHENVLCYIVERQLQHQINVILSFLCIYVMWT